jgi:hypothetical protein
MSLIDRATMVSLFVFQQHFPSIFYRFDVIATFRLAETGEMPISAARWRAIPEVTSPLKFLTQIWCNWPLENAL